MPAKPDRHNWNELHTYLHIHQTYLDLAMDQGIALSHDLGQFELLQDGARLIGRIVCRHGMFLDVDKQLEIMDRNGP